MKGELWKMGQLVNKAWKKRFFVLKDRTLYYFNMREDEVRTSVLTPSGSIPLRHCKVEPAQTKVMKEFAFQVVTGNRDYILSADNARDYSDWISIIQMASKDPEDESSEPPQPAPSQSPSQPSSTSFKFDSRESVGKRESATATTTATATATAATTTDSSQELPPRTAQDPPREVSGSRDSLKSNDLEYPSDSPTDDSRKNNRRAAPATAESRYVNFLPFSCRCVFVVAVCVFF
jgi:hypothetical protein